MPAIVSEKLHFLEKRDCSPEDQEVFWKSERESSTPQKKEKVSWWPEAVHGAEEGEGVNLLRFFVHLPPLAFLHDQS